MAPAVLPVNSTSSNSDHKTPELLQHNLSSDCGVPQTLRVSLLQVAVISLTTDIPTECHSSAANKLTWAIGYPNLSLSPAAFRRSNARGSLIGGKVEI